PLIKSISLRISILTIYAFTFVVLITTLIILSAINFFHSMNSVANTLLSDTANLVIERLNLEVNSSEHVVKLSQSIISSKQINDQDMPDYTLYVAKNIPYYNLPNTARIVGWGDEQGNSVETSRETDGTYSTRVIKPY